MSVLMMLAASGARETVTQTFTSNTTWPAPATTFSIDTLVGKGANGTPAGSGTITTQRTTITTTFFRRDGGREDVVEQTDGWTGGGAPTEHCDPVVTYTMEQSSVYSTSVKCFAYDTYEKPYSTSATTGANTTGFGKTFAGGVGGAATPVTHNNVAVTPGASYSLVIPSGGSITITYLK